MNESKHTPGTWNVCGNPIVVEPNEPGQGVCIANIETDGNYEASPDTRKANAKLIAAAPDLIEALKTLLVRFEVDHSWPENYYCYCAALAAIAKATT